MNLETDINNKAYGAVMKSTKAGWWKRGYKIASTLVAVVGVGYLVLLMFPQGLFAYSVERGKFRVYSREPVGVEEWAGALDKAEEKLKGSGLCDAGVRSDVYMTSHRAIYAFRGNKAYNPFANSVPLSTTSCSQLAGPVLSLPHSRDRR